MKRNILIYALCALFAFNFTSCKNEEEKTELEKRTEYLTDASKGWELTAATSSPAYVMLNGDLVTDLIKGGYLLDYELDDLVIYRATGALDVDPGKLTDPDGYTAAKNLGQWKFTDTEGKKLSTHIPFFYDETDANVNVLALTKDELRFNFSFNDNESPAKGEYTFTLTYKRK